jgi:protein-tyrosine phosphatase
MIDLHCHILPGVDDGAPDLGMALDMARMAVADGITVTACTPHILPGVYDNAPSSIRYRVELLRQALHEAEIPLDLVAGSDAHMRPDFAAAIGEDRILTLDGSRYVLFEPPHNLAPLRLEECLFDIQLAGYVPVLTHPERLLWIERHYAMITRLARAGVWMQITAGSLTGAMGKRPQYWAERMLSEGLVHILASDAHNCTTRPPMLAPARALAARLVGAEEATHLLVTRPLGILNNADPATLPASAAIPRVPERVSLWQRVVNVVRA